MEVSGQLHTLATLLPHKESQYPFKTGLGRCQGSLDISNKSRISCPCQELKPRSSHTNYVYSQKYNTSSAAAAAAAVVVVAVVVVVVVVVVVTLL
jgi:hypothetical protein